MADPTILTFFHKNPESAGPFTVPPPAALTSVSVVLRHELVNAAVQYRTVAYLVGPAAANTVITLAGTTAWLVVLDLPGGLDTSFADMEKAFAKPGGATPDGGGTTPPPGPIHGGTMM